MNDAAGTQKPSSIRDSAQNHLSGRVMTVGDLRACKDPSRAAIDVLAALTGINLTVRRIGYNCWPRTRVGS